MHHDGEKIAIETRQDVSRALDDNLRQRNAFEGYRDRGSHHMHHVAHIPNVVIDQWMAEGLDVFNPDHAERVWKRLNDSDWRKLRTTEGWV
jgi:hypothetical protein